ncbi:hypothetical protein PMAC_002173 [Pneumocystis sp. 'macacae']|nr:hypothetical protein PMAC_002173 [Pneumocystis sp. 'macacae']
MRRNNARVNVQQATETPSQVSGIPRQLEGRMRRAGTELIRQAGVALGLHITCTVTAQVLLQRFYYVESLRKFSVVEIAMGAIFLASKITERPAKIRDIVGVFWTLVGTRRGEKAESLTEEVNIAIKRTILTESGAIYGERKNFELPYGQAMQYLQILGLAEEKEIAQKVWSYINDTMCTIVPCVEPAACIAVGCIYVAANEAGIRFPDRWWQVFDVDEEDIIYIATCVKSFYIEEKERKKHEQERRTPIELDELEEYLAEVSVKEHLDGA